MRIVDAGDAENRGLPQGVRCAPASPAWRTSCSLIPKTILLFGDAKDTLTKLLAAVKGA
jgi:hypothetical protein